MFIKIKAEFLIVSILLSALNGSRDCFCLCIFRFESWDGFCHFSSSFFQVQSLLVLGSQTLVINKVKRLESCAR